MPTRSKESLDQAPLSHFLRRKIRKSLWGTGYVLDEIPNLTEDLYYPYFSFYEAQCTNIARHAGRELWATDHEDPLKVIRYVKDGDQTRDSLVGKLQEQRVVADKASIEDTIELATRLLLILSIGNPKHSLTSGQRIIEWKGGTLGELVTDYFSSSHTLCNHVKLPRLFNALHLDCRPKSTWIHNLADHLLLREDDTKVYIFHYASFLRCHKSGDW